MKNKLTANILEKYFRGDCNESEIAEILSWYNSFEHDEDDISTLSDEEKEAFRMLMLNNIRQNVNTIESNNRVTLPRRKINHPLFYFVAGVAATLLIVLLFEYKKPVTNDTPASKEITVYNNTNAIEKIILSDGSKVWLSPRSEMKYLNLFEHTKREVAMSGEAFFEVTRDHKRPFLIYSGNVTTKVWGTSFRIRVFKNEITKVDVVTGKVSVSVPVLNKPTANLIDQPREVMLTPNQEAAYDSYSNNLKKNLLINDPTITIWKKISISFDNTPMPQVFAILNKKFKVHIRSDDKEINADSLNADFTDESLPAIMEIMRKILNVTYVTNGNDFVLSSNK